MRALAMLAEEHGVAVRSADVNGFAVAELRFPPGYVQAEFEPEHPYVALVLEGSLEKQFRGRAMELERSCAVTMPAGATHGARFGAAGARVVIVKTRARSGQCAVALNRLGSLRAPAFASLAWRLAAELRATDAAAPLAAEGLALEVWAAARRETSGLRDAARGPRWLSAAAERLRACTGDFLGLGELAASLGVPPTQLARAFRAQYGMSVGEYGRRVRVAWAVRELSESDTPVAAVASEAGFADQSHFTRLFKRYVGTTPARYRAETRAQRRR